MKLTVPKTANPFRINQHIQKLIDVIKEIQISNNDLSKEIQALKKENEILKENWISPGVQLARLCRRQL